MTRIHASLLRRATFAVLGLATAHPQAASAQSLTLTGNDNATVSGLGTVGIVGGIPVAKSTTSYNDSDGNGYAIFTKDASTFTLGSGATLTATEFEGTTLNINGSGGVTANGGTDNSSGQFGVGLGNYGSGVATVNGGTIIASGIGGQGLFSDGSGDVTITGGTISSSGENGIGLSQFGSADIEITGGTITASGPNGIVLQTGGTGVINLYGSFIDQKGVPLTLGQTENLPAGPTSLGSFYGILENNTAGQTFTYLNNGSITLHDVGLIPAATPEPSASIGLSIGLLGLGALGVKARRRVAV